MNASFQNIFDPMTNWMMTHVNQNRTNYNWIENVNNLWNNIKNKLIFKIAFPLSDLVSNGLLKFLL